MATRTTAPKTDAVAFQTRNDIDAESRAKLISLLNQHLADTFDLMSQTKFAHWNVKGPNFIAVHKLFDELAEKLEEHVDNIAERTTAIGGIAMGTVRQASAMSHTPEFPSGVHKDMDVVAALADRYAGLGKSVRAAMDEAEELGDQDTLDLFVQLSRDLDHSLYFLEAHLQG